MNNRKNLAAAALLLAGAPAAASEITFVWDPVPDARVGVYELAWGGAPGVYDLGTVTVAPATATITVGAGEYVAAVRACTADQTLCSAWSNEVAFTAVDDLLPPGGLQIRLQISVSAP